MSPLASDLRPVDPDAVVEAVAALAAGATAGAVLVVDLDRLPLLASGRAALDRALEAVRRTLAGRAPWLRPADDVVAVVAPLVADEAEAAALGRSLLAAVRDAAEVGPDLPWTPACGVAWADPAGEALLPAALAACWRARHGGPELVAAGDGRTVASVAAAEPAAPTPPAPPSRRPRPVPVPVADAPRTAVSPLDEFLVTVSGHALGLEPAAFVARLDEVLADLVAVAGVDYAFVDVLAADGVTVLNLGGASTPEHAGFVRAEPRLLEPDDPWRRMLTELEPVAVDDQFSSHDGAHPANHPLGCAARSFLTVPFVVGGAMAGALGVGCVDRARHWSPADVNGVRLTTGLVAAVLERDRLGRDPSA